MKVLLVDNDSLMLSQLEKSMSKWGYTLFKAENGQQALDRLGKEDIDLIISGWLTAEMNALDLCRQTRAVDSKHKVYFLLLASRANCNDLVRGCRNGPDDYLATPLNMDELQARLDIGIRILRLERELDQKFLVLKRNYYQSVQMVTQLLETYDKHLGGHSRRVGQYALQLANRHPGVKPEDYPIVEAAGLLHDIGLIGLSKALVTKSIPEMNGEERKAYHAHPERGELILNQIDLLRPVAKIVRLHHEQPNGRGFPDGLAGHQIPIAAELIGAASTYDHLVQHKKLALDQLPERLQQYRGYRISSEIVDLLLEINLERIEAEAKRTFRKVDIEELHAGMVLATDIHMRTGAFVMGAGTCIDASVIEKLMRYHELGNISRNVFIQK